MGAGILGGLLLMLLTAPAAGDILSKLSSLPPPGPRQPVRVEAFYDVLRDYGTWLDTDRFGTLFCPHPDIVGPDFQPYSQGHWVMSEDGWTFVGRNKISWVTDHYGRWVETGMPGCNWGWLPGGVWSPAWVEFRASERVIAWRPLPYTGGPVHLHLAAQASLPQVSLAPPNFSSDAGFVAVPDDDFTARHVEDVALSGVQLYNSLRDTVALSDATVRAGLHSVERDVMVAQAQKARNGSGDNKALAAGGSSPAGAAPEPARRRRSTATGSSGTLRAGVPGSNLPGIGGREGPGGSGAPGANPPNRTNMSTGSSPGSPGTLQGVKALEWGKPNTPKLPPPEPPPKPSVPSKPSSE